MRRRRRERRRRRRRRVENLMRIKRHQERLVHVNAFICNILYVM